MKLLIIMFACLCLNNPPQPEKDVKKKPAPLKKEKKASINLAPSILINF